MPGRGPQRPRSPQANREKRGGKILSAHRRIRDGDAQLLAGHVMELSADDDRLPGFQAGDMRAFVLDPRAIGGRARRGFLTAEQCRRVVARAEHDERIGIDHIDISLGEPRLLEGRRRAIVAPLVSEQLMQECVAFNQLLRAEGVPGFSANGMPRGRRKMKPLMMPLGSFDGPIPKSEEAHTLDVVASGLEIAQLNMDGRLRLGKLAITPRPVKR